MSKLQEPLKHVSNKEKDSTDRLENISKTEANFSLNKTQAESLKSENAAKGTPTPLKNSERPGTPNTFTHNTADTQTPEKTLQLQLTPTPTSVEKVGPDNDAAAPSFDEGIDWFSLSISICVAATTFDYNQIHMLGYAARNHGGFYFIACYIVVSIMLGFPLLNHAFHISQFTQTGLTKVWGMHTELFRCIGFAMLVLVVYLLALDVLLSAEIVSYVLRIYDNPLKVVTCERDGPFDCNPTEEIKILRDCCFSLSLSMECEKTHNWTLSLGSSYCVPGYPSNIALIGAPTLFAQKQAAERFGHFQYDNFVAALVILAIVTGLAWLGVRIFSYINSVVYCLAVLMMTVWGISMLFVGNFGEGWKMLVRLSEPEKVFSLGFVSVLSAMVYNKSCFKFAMVSITSYHPQKLKYFWVAAVIHFGQLIFVLFLLLADVSMGMRHTDDKFPRTTYQMSPNHLAFYGIIPELFSTFSGNKFGFWFYMYYVMAFCSNFGTICSAFFVCFTIVRDHFPNAPIWLEKAFCAALAAATVVALLIVQLLDQNYEVMIAVLGIWSGVLWTLGLLATITIYGSLEVLLDISTIHPPDEKFHKFLKPVMHSRLWVLGVATPHFLAFLGLTLFPIIIHSFMVHSSVPQLLSQFFLILSPLVVLLFYLVNDVRNTIKEGKPLWKLWYPCSQNPSYVRIIPDDFSLRNLTMEDIKKDL